MHNYYRNAGGEDVVFDLESNLLLKDGLTVRSLSTHNGEITGIRGKMSAALSVNHNARSINKLNAEITNFSPDIIHIHNFFPIFSPGIHILSAKANVAVVQTLHNYRLLCASGQLFRNGHVCEDCIKFSRFSAVLNRCYRKSALGTAAVISMQNKSINNPYWVDSIDRFIVLSEFQKAKFISKGISSDKIIVKPNFFPDPGEPLPERSRGNYAVYVGRFSQEKGIRQLIRAWRNLPEIKLKLIGDGPEMDWVKFHAPQNVEICGWLTQTEAIDEIRSARLLVFPSTWHEPFGLTIIQALACGTPVVASEVGSIPEILKDDYSAELYASLNQETLIKAVKRTLQKNFMKASNCAREIYLQKYTPDTNLESLKNIYSDAIEAQKNKKKHV